MANETNNDFTNAVANMLNASSSLVQQSLELLSSGVKGTVQAIEPLGKTAIDLLGSATNTLGQVVQSVTSVIAPKK
ncbi:MAG: chlorosome envelope protein B [Chlorobiaceae bacterium]